MYVWFQLNVLIDDSDKALLCDFGLTRMKADVTSRTVRPGGGLMGSRNWMAPERLMGGSLKKPCDIYAFGMTLHEVARPSFVKVFRLKQFVRFMRKRFRWVT